MVDVDAQIAAVSRAYRTESDDGEEMHVQSVAQEYASGIDDVWDAVTSSERIPRWFLPITGQLRVGGRYQLEGNAGGEVLECDPPVDGRGRYRATWEYGGGVSWIVVELEDIGEGATRVELTHFARTADIPDTMWDQFGPGATGVGWDGGLLGLAVHLRGDGTLSPVNVKDWAATDDGKRFYRGAADGWAQAHAASGVEHGKARRAADATYAFYTGADAAS
ncbi:SRPBCC family protein [Microbacterium suaedae]|uniref:SRPBCC family protein n=1 Tax=Microbacterium suaedae TaxID=2067813 RepID=UPI000DA13BBF|nr:SRPBCC family protein [Microbacterium suaedae]